MRTKKEKKVQLVLVSRAKKYNLEMGDISEREKKDTKRYTVLIK